MESWYPATRNQPLGGPDYSSVADRRRLRSQALWYFFKIMRKWKSDAKDVRPLLGGITGRLLKHLSTSAEGRILTQDQLLKATGVFAISNCLHKLLPW